MTDTLDNVKSTIDRAEDVAPVEDLSPPGYNAPPPRTPDLPQPEIEGALLPLNDTRNGKRLALYYGEDLRTVPRIGWFVWDGRHWKPDEDETELREKCQQVQHHIKAEIPHLELTGAEKRAVERLEQIRFELRDFEETNADLSDEERAEKREKLIADRDRLNTGSWGRGSTRQKHITFAKSAGISGAIKNMALESTVELSRAIESLDSDQLMINTETCLLKFKVEGGGEAGFSRTASFERVDHARELPGPDGAGVQLITKMMPVEYDPKAECPLFDKFLRRIQPDEEMRRFLQRWFELSMTGLRVQKFAFFYGDGANGKSVLTDLISRMLDG